MTTNFKAAVDFVLSNEGGFSDNPSDPGGATNHGVSLRALLQLEGGNLSEWDLDHDGDIDEHDIRKLTPAKAANFYRKHYWHWRYEQLPQAIATKMLDLAVNTGTRQAVKILQRACNFDTKRLKVDGVLGPKTADAVNMLERVMPYVLTAAQAKFYFSLVDARPARGVFLLGWLRRAYRWP